MRLLFMPPAAIAFLLLPASVIWGADPDTKPRAGIEVWDTGQPSPASLPPAAITEKKGWTAVAAEKLASSFQGDAVLSNGRIVAVLRKQDSAIEIYSQQADGVVSRCRIRLLTADGEPATRPERVA